MPDNRERRLPDPSAARSNSRSTSLSGPAVPCAIDPKSRGLLAPYLANTLRIASRCSRRRSNVRLLYVLVTPTLRPVRDNPSALVPDGESAGLRALTAVADLDNRTVLGFRHENRKKPPRQAKRKNTEGVPSSIMIDKITTVHRSKLGQRIGKVTTTEMLQLERGLLVYLGMTG